MVCWQYFCSANKPHRTDFATWEQTSIACILVYYQYTSDQFLRPFYFILFISLYFTVPFFVAFQPSSPWFSEEIRAARRGAARYPEEAEDACLKSTRLNCKIVGDLLTVRAIASGVTDVLVVTHGEIWLLEERPIIVAHPSNAGDDPFCRELLPVLPGLDVSLSSAIPNGDGDISLAPALQESQFNVISGDTPVKRH